MATLAEEIGEYEEEEEEVQPKLKEKQRKPQEIPDEEYVKRGLKIHGESYPAYKPMTPKIEENAVYFWVHDTIKERWIKELERKERSSIVFIFRKGQSLSEAIDLSLITETAGEGHFEEKLMKSMMDFKILDFEVKKLNEWPNGSPTEYSLNTLLGLTVDYIVDQTRRTQSFILKIPPDGCEEDRDMSEIFDLVDRELYFFVQIIPCLKNWIILNGAHLTFPVPEFISGRIEGPLRRYPLKDIENTFPLAENYLLFEDLTVDGYKKISYIDGLFYEEAKAAIYALAKVHALTWVLIDRKDDEILFQNENHHEKAIHYYICVKDGLKTLKEFLKRRGQCNERLKFISIIENRLCGLIVYLLDPSRARHTLPTTMVHMDCWSNNLLFREKRYEIFESEPNISDRLDRIRNSYLDCRIVDWHMMTRGHPTHDLAILIGTSMSAATRRDYLDAMISYYCQIFNDITTHFGYENLPFKVDNIKEEYKKSQIFAFFYILASIDVALKHDVTQERLLNLLDDIIKDMDEFTFLN